MEFETAADRRWNDTEAAHREITSRIATLRAKAREHRARTGVRGPVAVMFDGNGDVQSVRADSRGADAERFRWFAMARRQPASDLERGDRLRAMQLEIARGY